jgi:hypothetical protein
MIIRSGSVAKKPNRPNSDKTVGCKSMANSGCFSKRSFKSVYTIPSRVAALSCRFNWSRDTSMGVFLAIVKYE